MRSNFLRTRARGFLLAGAVVALALACAEPTGTTAVSTSVRDIPGTVRVKLPIVWDNGEFGGTWYDTYSDEPKSYNLFSNVDGTNRIVTGLIIDHLFDYDPIKREWTGNIIESFEVRTNPATDTMELTCVLREGITWSDGVPMTSDDVLYWYYELDGDPDVYLRGYQGQFIEMADGSKKRIELKKVDDRTFTYVFPRVVANPILMVNTSDIVAKHIWEPVKTRGGARAVRDFWGLDTPPEQLVGNGPFLLERNVPGERLIFRRNPNYWQKDAKGNRLPYLDRIVLTLTRDVNAELLRFQRGEIEAYSLRGKDLATLLPDAKSKGYSIWNGGTAGGYPAIIFNQNPRALSEAKHRWFNDANFRKAVSSLIDRETIINQTVNGLAEPLYHIISEYNRYYNPERATPYDFNIERARNLLAKVGFADKNGDGVLEDADGTEAAFDLMTTTADPTTAEVLSIVINDMRKVGLKPNLVVVDREVVVNKLLNTHDWDGYLASFSFPLFVEQWYNIWRSDGDFHFWNPKQESPQNEWEKRIDELYEKLIFTYDDAEVRKLYDEFQQVLLDELVIIPIYRRYTFTAVYDKWGNVNWDVMHAMGDGNRRIFVKQ